MIHYPLTTPIPAIVNLYWLKNQNCPCEWLKCEIIGLSFYKDNAVTCQIVIQGCLYSYVPLVALSLKEKESPPYRTIYSKGFICPGGNAEVYNFPYMEGKKLYIKGLPTETYTYCCTIDFVDTNIQVHLVSDCYDGSLRIVAQPHMTIECAWHNRLQLEKQRSEWT